MANVEKVATEITRAVRDFVSRSLQARDARIAELEGRLAAIETTQKAARYCGTWQRDQEYSKHNLCTHDGSLWIAIADAPGKPGSYGWQLCAKRGADGKDAR